MDRDGVDSSSSAEASTALPLKHLLSTDASNALASSSSVLPPSHDSVVPWDAQLSNGDPGPDELDSTTQGIDVDLGAIKSVSRLHAKIVFDHDESAFVLEVLGRNGAWVDDEFVGPGERASLHARSVKVTPCRFVCSIP